MKVLGLDYGEKRIGVAISDDLLMFAHAHAVLEDLTEDQVVVYLTKLIQEEDIETIVLGLPRTLSGEDSAKTLEVRDFALRLEDSLPVEVVFEDERWSTRAADRILHEQGLSEKEMRLKKDMIAAVVILQTYLDRRAQEE